MSERIKDKNVFMEYRRGLFPDTEINAFEGIRNCFGIMHRACSRNYRCEELPDYCWASYETMVIDDSRIYKIFMN